MLSALSALVIVAICTAEAGDADGPPKKVPSLHNTTQKTDADGACDAKEIELLLKQGADVNEAQVCQDCLFVAKIFC